MIDKINEKKEELQIKYENTIKAMQSVKEQIQVFNKKGEELAMEATYLKGKLDMLKELEGEEDV